MASNYTSNYKLCQWAAGDKVLRTEFNADNAKIDAAIQAVNQRVNGRVEQAALDAVKNSVSAQAAQLLTKGNCRIALERYTGSGAESRTHTFPEKPLLVILYDGTAMIIAAPGMNTVYKRVANGSGSMNASWSGTSMTLSAANADTLLNNSGWSYYRLAFFDAEA